MATPCVAFGKVEVQYRQEKPCPRGWGVDADGMPSEDPSAILFGGGLCPLGGAEESGGYKGPLLPASSQQPPSATASVQRSADPPSSLPQGYGLGLMVEMLCGITSGSNCGPDVPQVGAPTSCLPFLFSSDLIRLSHENRR